MRLVDDCKAMSSRDGRIVVITDGSQVIGMAVDGVEIDVTPASVHTAAKEANADYDLYSGWSDDHILLEAMGAEIGCEDCPYRQVCDIWQEYGAE